MFLPSAISVPAMKNNAFRNRQTGVALITAVLIMMLAVTIAAFLLAQQSKALSRTERGVARAQASLTTGPALDWARAILAEPQKATYVHRKQPWAQPLIGQPIDGASVGGRLTDEDGKFNLNNLVTDNGQASAADIAFFKRLLSRLEVHESLADSITDWIDADREPQGGTGAEDRFYLAQSKPYRAANRRLVQIDELHYVRGVTAETLARLRPFITALSTRTRINLNTAPRDVLAALFEDTAPDELTLLLRAREEDAFTELADVKKRFPKLDTNVLERFGSVSSQYFLAEISITQETSQLRQQALLQRKAAPQWPRIVWVKNS